MRTPTTHVPPATTTMHTTKRPQRHAAPKVSPRHNCTSFWTPQWACHSLGFNNFTVELCLLLPLLLLHTSMVVFIVAHGRRDWDFRQAFFVQYAAVSVVNCVRMAGQIFDDVLLWRELFSIGDTTVQIDDAFGIILPCAQAMLHLLIAANRFTAFFLPLSHSSIWNKRLTFVPVLSVVVLSISVFVGTIYGLRLVPDDGTHDREPWNNFAYFYVPFGYSASGFICCFCTTVSFLLSITTIVKLRFLARSGQLRSTQNVRDLKLLLHSTFMVLVQFVMAVDTLSTLLYFFEMHSDTNEASYVKWTHPPFRPRSTGP